MKKNHPLTKVSGQLSLSSNEDRYCWKTYFIKKSYPAVNRAAFLSFVKNHQLYNPDNIQTSRGLVFSHHRGFRPKPSTPLWCINKSEGTLCTLTYMLKNLYNRCSATTRCMNRRRSHSAIHLSCRIGILPEGAHWESRYNLPVHLAHWNRCQSIL